MQPYFVPYRPLAESVKERLREDGNFIGGMLIMLVTLLSFCMTVLSLLFVVFGQLSPADLAAADLNMGNTGYLLFYAAVYTLSMGLPSLLGMLLFRRDVRRLVPAKRASFATAVSGLAIGLGACMAANMVAGYVSRWLSRFGIPQPEAPDLIRPTSVSLLLNLLAMAVLPALLEELLFRGCILQTLRRYGDRMAVLFTALLFGVTHGGFSQSVFAFLVGLVLGWLVVNTENVWLAVLLHFLNNAISVLLQYLSIGLSDTATGVLYALVMYGLGAIGLIVLVVCAVRRSSVLRLPPRGQLPAGACIATVWQTPLMIIATVLLFLRMAQMALA